MSNPVQTVVPDWTLECDDESTMVVLKRIPNRGSWISLYGNKTRYLARGITASQPLLPDGSIPCFHCDGNTMETRTFVSSLFPFIHPSTPFHHNGTFEAVPVAHIYTNSVVL
jgi:hypothetical protein